MKKDSDLHLTIIGLGQLMEAVWESIAQMVGRDRLSMQVNATTVDRTDIRRKQEVFGINIFLNDNLRALEEMEPDIVLFAPPPAVAASIVQEELRPYFESRRRLGKPAPEIYAFPPVPDGSFYLEHLGKETPVANIIPIIYNSIGGKPSQGEGLFIYTVPAPLPEKSKARLHRMFGAHGTAVQLQPPELIPMLGGLVTAHTMWEGVMTLCDAVSARDRKIDHKRAGNYLRARALNTYEIESSRSGRGSLEAVDSPLQCIFDAFLRALHDGIRDYFGETGFPEDKAQTLLLQALDLDLYILQVEPREIITHHLDVAATKGGLLERALVFFHDSTEALLRDAVTGYPETPRNGWEEKLRRNYKEMAHEIRNHGLALAK